MLGLRGLLQHAAAICQASVRTRSGLGRRQVGADASQPGLPPEQGATGLGIFCGGAGTLGGRACAVRARNEVTDAICVGRRSERLAKYNQLLRIEEELGDAAVYAGDNWRHIGW